MNCRIYYRNTFLHLGHCQTILYNNEYAKDKNGQCYAIIDDRQYDADVSMIMEDINYLKLHYIKCLSVIEHLPMILDFTQGLIKKGIIYVDQNLKQKHEIIEGQQNPVNLKHLTMSCRLKFNMKYVNPESQIPDIIIATTKYDHGSYYTLNFIFDYIIKVLDILYKVTDVIKTNNSDISDENIFNFFHSIDEFPKVIYHNLKTYQIFGFKYSKTKWPDLDKSDIRLLTLKGLKARHVPPEAIHCFYKYGISLGQIEINKLYSFCLAYLKHHSIRGNAVPEPIKIEITNMQNRLTEYVKIPYNQLSDKCYLSAISNVIYINKTDYGMVYTPGNLSLNTYGKLRYAYYFYCHNTDLNSNANISLIQIRKQENIVPSKLLNPRQIKGGIPWVSSIYGKTPRVVRFIFPGWFYTGNNTISDGIIYRDGYIDEFMYEQRDQYLYFERLGYFAYDQKYSKKHGIPCFICIISI